MKLGVLKKRLLNVVMMIVAVVWGIPWVFFSMFFPISVYNQLGSFNIAQWLVASLEVLTSFPVFALAVLIFLIANYIITGERKSARLDSQVLETFGGVIAVNAISTATFFLLSAPT